MGEDERRERPVAYRLTEWTRLGIWKVLESGNGWFHLWFEDRESNDCGGDSWLWAIVEKQDGSIIEVRSQEIQFLDIKGAE